MLTEIDEGKGLVKVYWSDIRKRIAKVEPAFVKIVDELNPDKKFPLYLAYYPYGSLTGDTQTIFLPKQNKGEYRLTDPSAPRDVIKDLGYGIDSSPLGMVLDKSTELFIDLKNEGITIPWSISSPGAFFSFARILSKKSNRIYAPNGLLTETSGARSAFMLPNIGCATNHANLQRDFNVQNPPPKFLYDHWHVFKEICNSDVINNEWRSCLLYFSERWINKIHNDKSWIQLKLYLHEMAWHYYEYERNHVYYDIAFSIIQRKRNLKPNPYLADTARHLFATALGDAPGYEPAVTDNALPLKILQKAFIDSYGLKKYFPIIMQPVHYNFEEDPFPIYYSLQNPSTHVFSPRSREVSSTLIEMRELEHIMRIFVEELKKENGICSDTIINKIAKNIEFNYFHNKLDRHRIVAKSSNIPSFDSRFCSKDSNFYHNEATFACDAPFVRGCISIKSVK